MVILSDVLPALSLTTATGCAGLVLGTASTFIAGRRAGLAVQAAGCVLFAAHYGLLGASTATLMCALGLLQMATAYPGERPAWARAVFLATLPAGLCVAAATWHGAMTAFSAMGFVLGTLGRWQTSMRAMRGCYATATLFGAGHNALAGSLFGLGSDALALSGHLWSLWRLKAKRPPAGTGGRIGAADRVSAWLPPRRPAPCAAGRSW